MAQWVKDPALSLQQLGWLLRHGFSPWHGNFRMPWALPHAMGITKKKMNLKPKWHPLHLSNGYTPILLCIFLNIVIKFLMELNHIDPK